MAQGDDAREVEVDGRRVRLTNLDKVLWPSLGLTKSWMIDHYVRTAPALLPHVAGRPLTLHRFPDGVAGNHWYETRCPAYAPPWLRVQQMYTFRRSGKDVRACVVDDLPGLVWAANVAAVELHPFLAPVDHLDHPDVAVFDLDPGAPAGIADACRVALEVRTLLEAVGVRGYPKTSGGKGIHIHVPVAPDHPYDVTKAFARAVAAELSVRAPDRVVDRMTRSLRAGKVLVDWSQNDAGKSTVAPYSLRGHVRPTVALPLTWDEVDAGARGAPLPCSPADALDRLDRLGDLFAPVLSDRQRLPG